MSEVYVALGSNLGDRCATLRAGAAALDALPGLRLREMSRLMLTEPVGGPPQPHFVNAVARLESALSPRALLRKLQYIEARFHRRRDVTDGPRTLDLDLILYGTLSLRTPELEVPHPRMEERAFVLAPLAELAPRLRLPSGVSVRERLHDGEVAA